MCGILGFIGQSSDQFKTEQLITELFETMQVRGTDAAGFYCVSSENQIHHYKQPGTSTEIIKTELYKNLWSKNLELGIFHCRAASVGVGPPSENINNHPFVSDDYKKSIIHNGLINSKEYEFLKQFFDVQTECDSEIVLRVLEKNDDIIKNIKFLFDHTKSSYFAIAYAEIQDSIKRLILTRNKHRPLFFVDVRQECGQILFFSTFEIFLSALNTLKAKDIDIEIYKNFYNIKPYEVFAFELSDNNQICMKKYFAEEKIILSQENIKKTAKSLQEQVVLDYISTAKEKIKEVENGIKIMIESKNLKESDLSDIITHVDQINITLDSINTDYLSQ